MSYAKQIEEILSDGRWHCILSLISETGLSARNRISEMNQDYQNSLGYPLNSKDPDHLRYLGSKCTLEKCNHKAKMFMYILNQPYYKNSLAQIKTQDAPDPEAFVLVPEDQLIEKSIDQAGRKEMDEEWDKISREEKKARINAMISKVGGIDQIK
jgi:hypothetical protein